MSEKVTVLGIDAGSVSVGIVEMDTAGNIRQTGYRFHRGHVAETIREILTEFNTKTVVDIGATTSTPEIVSRAKRIDNRIAVIAGARRFHRKIGSILMIGGETFGAIGFDPEGNYRSYRANTPCAAGTGSFLDQQAKRLNFTDAAHLSEAASGNNGTLPSIASRCAVFAKTDLVHAQQQGYSLGQIADGLCRGLAKNVVDTLFPSGLPQPPVVFVGGVSRNEAVRKHLCALSGCIVRTDAYSHLYGAVGCAVSLISEIRPDAVPCRPGDRIVEKPARRKYADRPLALELTAYPPMNGKQRYEYHRDSDDSIAVEVDIYKTIQPGSPVNAILGIDIGSTSTKAVLMDQSNTITMLAGVYTRTAGNPVGAVQRLFEALDSWTRETGAAFEIVAAGTTGAGRKFIGKLINADLVVDEITAHARAATELRPDVDTIIEIGGQDAKFTILRNGQVTFSTMNSVCAAGTGSFIEEQAKKLGCPIDDYAARAENKRSPLTSDRCTVFMERDLNYRLREGYSVDEILASALRAVCENYLSKVALESSIGDVILFQGATGKNRALIAAFEQRLGKPIHVSRYCHLTGAMGAAMILSDEGIAATGFRGLGIHRQAIGTTTEVCGLCANSCKITLARIGGEKVAYGFLCGRDYDNPRRGDANRSGYDLYKGRREAFAFRKRTADGRLPVLGLPAALHVMEDLSFWEYFFDCLSVPTVTSRGFTKAVSRGKQLAGAEFCSPMVSLYGHVDYLQNRADAVFLPFYLDRKSHQKGIRRQYCYYTQFASALAAGAGRNAATILSPLLYYLYSPFYTKVQLYRSLKEVYKNRFRFLDISAAYEKALSFQHKAVRKLENQYRAVVDSRDQPAVILLGRPYSVLSHEMNKGIPEIFASLGIKTVYQDMVPRATPHNEGIEPLLRELHWNYAAQVLEKAEIAAETKGLYPVLITSFKCAPDSFVIDYFKKIMEAHGKPYLVLQVDDHGANTGYETRIEAALRSFANHHTTAASKQPPVFGPAVIPSVADSIQGKTIFFPNWDDYGLPLVVANLQREGFDARLLESSDERIQKSMRYNQGQCIPLNIIAQNYMDAVETHGLDPARTLLWIGKASVPCNLRLYPHHINCILQAGGKKMAHPQVYAGSLSLADISRRLPLNTYFAYMIGGYLRKIGCRIRPYEKIPGATDDAIRRSMRLLVRAFGGKYSKESAVNESVSMLERIETIPDIRPKVAIFGDMYARDNPVMNQDLIRFIEENGGEVVVTPYTEFLKIITAPYLRKWLFEGNYWETISTAALMAAVKQMERRYYRHFQRILREPQPRYNDTAEAILAAYGLRIEHTGETMENLLKIHYLSTHYPDLSMFVQTSPAFCCPSLVTEAFSDAIEEKTGCPVVTIIYDGTGGRKNDIILPYLKFPRKTAGSPTRKRA